MNTPFQKIIFLVMLLLYVSKGQAQRIIFEQENYVDSFDERYGQKARNYLHAYVKYGFNMNSFFQKCNCGNAINNFKSNEFGFGMLYKKKMNKYFDLGFSFGYLTNKYDIKQASSKVFPDSILHQNEVLVYHMLELDAFYRMNIGKKGSKIRYFLDLGPFVNSAFSISHNTTDENVIPTAKKTQVRNYHLKYTNHFNYGAFFRLGYGRYVLYSKYRFSNLFKPSYGFPELPRYTLGIELGLY